MLTPEAALYQEMVNFGVPSHLHEGLYNWITGQMPPGGFLQNLLANNLKETFEKADCKSMPKIENIIRFLYNEAPANCWGSPEKVVDWCQQYWWGSLEPTNCKDIIRARNKQAGTNG